MSWSALPFPPLAAGERLPHEFGPGRAAPGSHWPLFWSARSSSMAGRVETQAEDSVGMPMLRPATLAHVPVSIRLLMAEAALSSGRDEGDLWTEAAGDWLRRHAFDNDPVPPAPAGALAVPRRKSSWDAIDDLLTTLRQAGVSPTQIGTEQAA
jgi:hypothetical protein